MSKKVQATLSYVEEDGWAIQRGETVYWVYGTCEGDYEYSFTPGKYYGPWEDSYPDEEDLDQLSFDCWIDNICDEGGNEVEITLTDEEMKSFEAYMDNKLEKVANEYDFNRRHDYDEE